MRNGIWLFAFALALLIIFVPSYNKIQILKAKNALYEAQIEELTRKNKEFAEEKRLLETDTVYLEKVAREKMGLARDGEVIFRVVPAAENQ